MVTVEFFENLDYSNKELQEVRKFVKKSAQGLLDNYHVAVKSYDGLIADGIYGDINFSLVKKRCHRLPNTDEIVVQDFNNDTRHEENATMRLLSKIQDGRLVNELITLYRPNTK